MPLWPAGDPPALASKREIRHALLRDAGVPLEVRPADIDERTIEQQSPARDAGELAALLAREKALAIAACLPGRLVLGADQTLALGERRFSQPRGRPRARAPLEAPPGRNPQVHTPVSPGRGGAVPVEHREVARLTMRAFSDSFLEAYLDAVGAVVTASVGGYQLERIGIQLFERIEGDHFVILGLPLVALLQYMRQAGWLAA